MSDIFFNTLMRLARIQRQPADRLALQQAATESADKKAGQAQLEFVAQQLHLPKILWLQPSEVGSITNAGIDVSCRFRLVYFTCPKCHGTVDCTTSRR